jgi:hypothetical protein
LISNAQSRHHQPEQDQGNANGAGDTLAVLEHFLANTTSVSSETLR